MAKLGPSISLQDLADRYGVFFVDQFGVLLDGAQPYPGAVAALAFLKSRGKTVIILSNSGRASDYNGRRLEKLGIGRDLYDHLVTSGDVAFSLVRTGWSGLPSSVGTPCFTISSGGDTNLADRLQFRNLPTADTAELLVISGSEADRIDLQSYREMLRPAAERGVPAICTNPDMEMLTGKGTAPGAGAIARVYEELGGKVGWIGKPHIAIYDHAFRLCGGPAKETLVAIGDSIEHDIAGATNFGIDAVLVRTGIHSRLSDAALAGLLEESGAFQPMVMSAFTLN